MDALVRAKRYVVALKHDLERGEKTEAEQKPGETNIASSSSSKSKSDPDCAQR